MNWPMVAAKWMLRLIGAIICLSFFAIFLPSQWMNTIHEWVGLGQLPKAPIVEYLARTISAMYFAHGLVILFVSFDVRRYWMFVGLIGIINIMLGSTFLLTDLKAEMPWVWTISEGPPIILGGIILLILWSLGKSTQTDSHQA